MLNLSATTDSIQVVLGEAQTANPMECVACYVQKGAGVFNPLPSGVVTNGTTPVTLVPAPAASQQHAVDYISVFNSDTANKTVIIRFNFNGVIRRIFSVVLAPNETLQYTKETGFQVYNTAGAIKTITTGTANPIQSGETVAILASDVINNNATANTIQNVTGLSFPVVANTRYYFKFTIFYFAAATTTGSRWSITGSGITFSELAYRSDYSLTTTTRTINDNLGAFDLPAASNASSALVSNIAIVEGFIRPTVGGNIIARFASEVSSSAITAKAGSFVRSRAL